MYPWNESGRIVKCIMVAMFIIASCVFFEMGCSGDSDDNDKCKACDDAVEECNENPPEPLYTGCGQDYCNCLAEANCPEDWAEGACE